MTALWLEKILNAFRGLCVWIVVDTASEVRKKDLIILTRGVT